MTCEYPVGRQKYRACPNSTGLGGPLCRRRHDTCVPSVAALTMAGSSRNRTNSSPDAGCGTGSIPPGKPSGTCLNGVVELGGPQRPNRAGTGPYPTAGRPPRSSRDIPATPGAATAPAWPAVASFPRRHRQPPESATRRKPTDRTLWPDPVWRRPRGHPQASRCRRRWTANSRRHRRRSPLRSVRSGRTPAASPCAPRTPMLNPAAIDPSR